ncbi:MAG: 6-phosphofructokinase [Flavobacteriales bacterium]|nr:6-phosphofructokinase [Flavobacteriales bacterium]
MTESKIKKIAVLTSGGDAPGMNAAIRAVVRTCVFNDVECVGVFKGYDGLISGDYKKLHVRSVSKILGRGGTILKSARSKEFFTKEGRAQAAEKLREANIDALVTIGGNGTFTGAHILNQEHGIPVMGIPGTIDNDLYGTDNTIGYDTATNTVVEAVDKIRDTANSHNRLFFVEVMGRDSGFIALRAGIATGAIAVLLPEEDLSIDDLIEILDRGAQSKKTSSVVLVAEGDANGGAYEVARKVTEKYSEYETRVTVLGHIQRGGVPSCWDRVLASRMGVGAVEGLLQGRTSDMVGVVNDRDEYTSLDEAVSKKVEPNVEELRMSKILSI